MNEELARLDAEAHKILADFVPDTLFDTHAHLYHEQFTTHLCRNKPGGPFVEYGWARYVQDMQNVAPGRTIHANIMPYPDKHLAVNRANRDASDAFTVPSRNRPPSARASSS